MPQLQLPILHAGKGMSNYNTSIALATLLHAGE
jgi:hypothetical protein